MATRALEGQGPRPTCQSWGTSGSACWQGFRVLGFRWPRRLVREHFSRSRLSASSREIVAGVERVVPQAIPHARFSLSVREFALSRATSGKTRADAEAWFSPVRKLDEIPLVSAVIGKKP